MPAKPPLASHEDIANAVEKERKRATVRSLDLSFNELAIDKIYHGGGDGGDGGAVLHEPNRKAGEGGAPVAEGELSEMQSGRELHGLSQMGTIPSAEEMRLHELGEATKKGNIPLLNDFLVRIVTLDTALIGGGFAAAKLDAIPHRICQVLVVLLLLSLLAGLEGLRPRDHKIDRSIYSEIARVERTTLFRKNLALTICAILFVVALLVAVVGFFAKG